MEITPFFFYNGLDIHFIFFKKEEKDIYSFGFTINGFSFKGTYEKKENIILLNNEEILIKIISDGSIYNEIISFKEQLVFEIKGFINKERRKNKNKK